MKAFDDYFPVGLANPNFFKRGENKNHEGE